MHSCSTRGHHEHSNWSRIPPPPPNLPCTSQSDMGIWGIIFFGNLICPIKCLIYLSLLNLFVTHMFVQSSNFIRQHLSPSVSHPRYLLTPSLHCLTVVYLHVENMNCLSITLNADCKCVSFSHTNPQAFSHCQYLSQNVWLYAARLLLHWMLTIIPLFYGADWFVVESLQSESGWPALMHPPQVWANRQTEVLEVPAHHRAPCFLPAWPTHSHHWCSRVNKTPPSRVPLTWMAGRKAPWEATGKDG